jgi:hypothetical protein
MIRGAESFGAEQKHTNNFLIKTTGSTGGLHSPYKGLLPD